MELHPVVIYGFLIKEAGHLLHLKELVTLLIASWFEGASSEVVRSEMVPAKLTST